MGLFAATPPVAGASRVLQIRQLLFKEEHPMKLQASILKGSILRHMFPALLLALVLSVANSAFAADNSQIPIAFASVSGIDGALQSGTSNVTSSYDSSTGLYRIKISGVCFDRLEYTTVATVSGYNGWPIGALFVNTNSGNCALTVQLTDVNGNLEQADFQVVVFKAK
jgi:hypothetical protein